MAGRSRPSSPRIAASDLGRRLLAQDGARDVARQDLGAGEDQGRDGEQRQQAKTQPSGDELQHRRLMAVVPPNPGGIPALGHP